MKSHATRPHATAAPTPVIIPPALRAATATGGQALDRHTQTQMSARFGHDFSQVRVHTDAQAAQSAQSEGANAYALGTDVVFGAGQWTPGSPATERLLAHELTHVVQQSQHGPGDLSRTSNRADEAEREAEHLAADVAAGETVSVEAHPGAAIARDPYPTFGDWKFKPTWSGSTDSTHDQQPGQPQANDRARRQQEDEAAAQRAGETDPRTKWWSPTPPDLSTPPSIPGLTPPFGPQAPAPTMPIPGVTPYTPPTFPGLTPPAGTGPQLTPPTFPNLGYQPPPISLGIPPLQLPPITAPAIPAVPPNPAATVPQPAAAPAAPAAPAATTPGQTPATPAVPPTPPPAPAPAPSQQDDNTAVS